MRRIAAIALVVGALIGTVQSVPLSWVTGDRLSAADPDAAALGTVWDGIIAHIDGLPPIFTSVEGTRLYLAANGPGLTLDGAATPQSLEDISMSLPIRALSRFDARLTGLAGSLDIDIDSLRWDDGGCTEATGTARTDVLAVNRALWNWQGPALSGPVTCRDGDVVVSLSGRDANGTVDADVSISPAGPYRTTITLTTGQPEAGAVLPLFGFEQAGGAWRLSESGSWQ